MNAREVLEFANQSSVKVVDFKFQDLPGTWQHFSASMNQLTEDVSLTLMADKMMLYKYIVRNVARRHGKTVTFMPNEFMLYFDI